MNKYRLLVSFCTLLFLTALVAGCKSPGIDSPISVSEVEFQLYSAFYNKALVPSDPDDVALVVKGEVLSGEGDLQSRMDALGRLFPNSEIWITDENGRKSTPGVVMTALTPNGNPGISWVFHVAKNSRSLTLSLPGGQTIRNVDSLVE